MRLLLVVFAAALSSLGGSQSAVPDRARAVRLSLPGWTEEKPRGAMRAWRDADGDLLSLAVVDSAVPVFNVFSESELQRSARKLAESDGAGLIEVAVVAPHPRSIVSLVYKRLERPAYLYTGMLVMYCRDYSVVWTAVAGERGTTGVREATVTAEMISSGKLTVESYQQSWAQDPYDPAYHGVDRSVLRFLSDDQRYDSRFPQHPLSKVRRVLAALPGSVAGIQ